MKTLYSLVTAVIALALLAAACSPTPTPAPTPLPPTDTPTAVATDTALPATDTPSVAATDTPMPATDTPSAAATNTAAPTSAAPAGPASVDLSKNATLGSFLVDAKGMTLYIFTKDTPSTSTCYDKCAAAWPALLTTGAPVAGTGVDASRLGTTKRTDGAIQVTYNGWPLYYFAKDAKPGDTAGQNVGSVWFVISPAGDKITK